MSIRRLLNVMLAFCCLLPAVVCADPVFLEAKPDAIDSKLLGQKRQIEVHLPSESAKDSSGRFETLYVLDGDWNTHLVVEIVEFMRQVGLVPPLIVVSVPNFFDEHGVNSRDHDLTPTVSSEQQRSGGAADFLGFLKTELLPYVDAHYPTNRVHLIHGHSYGGLFLVYALLHEPSLFDGYIVLDPALRWDDHALDAALREQLPSTPTKGKTIFIAGREGPAFDEMGIASAKTIFETRAPRDLHWKVTAYPEESHDSLKLKSTYDGLRLAYEGYTANQIRLVPNDGILVKGKPFYMVLDGGGFDQFNLHYTTDGSAPTNASPRIEAPFVVDDPEHTKVMLLSARGAFDRALPLELRSGRVIPAPRGAKPAPSWKIDYYAADAWPSLHEKPFKTDTAGSKLDFDDVGREAFAGGISGTLDIPSDGYYVIAVFTDKARVALSGKPLFEQDSAKGAPYRGFVVPLQRGIYPLRVDFLHAAKTSGLNFTVFQAKDGEPAWVKNKLVEMKSGGR